MARIRAALLFPLSLALAGCPKGTTPPPAATDAGGCNGTANEATEWVQFQTSIPIDAGAFDPLASSLFGAGAQAGQFASQQQLSESFWVTSEQDPTTPAQVRLTFSYDDGSDAGSRILAVTPASYQIGQLFIAAVDAAMAQMQSDVATGNAGGEIFSLQYQVTSTQGGTLSLGVNGNQGAYQLALSVTTPHTSLEQGEVGQAASDTPPYDWVSGTVYFLGMTQDTFDYFVSHAYGQGATAGQNFNNFELVPYDWLRLTVEPDISQNIVNVEFDVQTTTGTTVGLAKAPASVMAGGTFQTLVDRELTNMAAEEAAQKGSSTPWTVPFYYDQPAGGGVVQVIASGQAGSSSIAYSVASPEHPLNDVPFVPYKAVSFPDTTPPPACYQLGNPDITQALDGVFQITFTASNVITSDLPPDGGLEGTIGCSIFQASDVTVSGPIAGAQSLEDFEVPNANLLASTPPTFTTTTQLPDGDYQILCAQYVDGNVGNADQGDPVTLPIGGYTIACNVNPVTVQFAILDPSSQ